MPPSRAVATACLLLATVLPLAACGDNGDTPAADESSEVDAPSDSPTPEIPDSTEASEDPEPEPIPTDYPEIGLRFAELPTPTTKNRAALEVFVRFHRGRLQLLREAAMNDLVLDTAAEPVVAQWQDVVDALQETKTFFRGKAVLTVSDVAARSKVVVVDVCLDGSGLRLVENGRPGSFEGPSRTTFRSVVSRTDTGWAVTESRSLEGTC